MSKSNFMENEVYFLTFSSLYWRAVFWDLVAYGNGEGNGTPLQYFAWKIPGMEESDRLQSLGSLRVGNDWATLLHFSLSCIAEGNGSPLQCSCLENPRDGGAWWLLSMGSHRVRHDWSDLAGKKGTVTWGKGNSLFIKCYLFITFIICLAVLGLSCAHACKTLYSVWDLVSWPGIEPGSPALGGTVLATGPPGKFL